MQQHPLIPPPPPVRRLHRRTIGLAVVALAVGAGAIFLTAVSQQSATGTGTASRPVTEESASGVRPKASDELRLPSSYAQVSLVPPLADPMPTAPVVVQPVTTHSNPFLSQPMPQPGMPTPAVVPVAVSPRPAPAQARPAPQAPPVKEAPKRWFSSATPATGDVLTPPFPAEQEPGEGQGASKSALFPQAVWETPADPTKVLYADQVVQGLLMQSLNSDIPGTVRIKATETVYDRFGQGKVLLPIDTTFLGRQEGRTQYGQGRVPVTITMAILPDGTAIQWKHGQAGDATGATGIPASVDNHYGKVILGAGLSALLSIGTRAPFGSTSNFQQNLPQEFAQDTAQSLGQSAQGIVRRDLQVAPTLTVPYATPVTLQFSENVNFQTKPVMVHR